MGIFDTLLGRTRPVKANLDALFALPSAALTLQASAGLVPTGQAGVCFKPPAGQPFDDMLSQVKALLETGTGSTTSTASNSATGDDGGGTAAGADLAVSQQRDSFGYEWMVVDGSAIDDLVTRVHMVHSTLEENGWSQQLLCSVFGFTPGGSSDPDPFSTGVPDLATPPPPGSPGTRPGKSVYVIYLAKRGSFYIFAPIGKEQRDNEEELRLRAILGSDLPIEPDLQRWFPLWNLPLR
jgi:hypothetical protein